MALFDPNLWWFSQMPQKRLSQAAKKAAKEIANVRSNALRDCKVGFDPYPNPNPNPDRNPNFGAQWCHHGPVSPPQ